MCQCGQASFVDVPTATSSSLSSVASSSDESCCVDAAGPALGGAAGRSSPAYPTTQIAEKRRDGGPPPLTADSAAAPVHHVLAPGSPAHGPGRHCLLWACKACKKKNMNVDRRKVDKINLFTSVYKSYHTDSDHAECLFR